MDQELAYNILDILQTMQDAAKQMKEQYTAGKINEFNSLSMDLWEGLTAVREIAVQNVPEGSDIRLKDACDCALVSLKDIRLFTITEPEKVEWKLKYELTAIIETMKMQFYYWSVVKENPVKRDEFQEFLTETDAFKLLKIPEEKREYAVELSIQVTGYNHLDYTKQCVESVLKNLPENITTEIVVFNHGSSDDTKSYFEKIPEVKVINVAVNGVMPGVFFAAAGRGKYHVSISNDVIIGKNAIKNLYHSMKEHGEYGYIVPSTPGISNLQPIPAKYNNWEEFENFVANNNIYNEMQHEQRVRLCNPLDAMPSELLLRLGLDEYVNLWCAKNIMSFPDDKISLWMRRHRHKCILAKDAYCYHFGSVTIKKELGNIEEQQHFYKEGRKIFKSIYGVDPWGTGFCYDYNLFQGWNIDVIEDAHILGINCGIGSNSLKVKEVLREKGTNKVTLYNVTQDQEYLEDLKGISEFAYVFSDLKEIIKLTDRREFDYIVIDDKIAGLDWQNIGRAVIDAKISFREIAYRTSQGEYRVYSYRHFGT